MTDGSATHTARGYITQAISHSVEFQAGMLRFMQQHNYTHVETRPEKVDEWTPIVIKAGEALLSFKVDSWQNGANRCSGRGPETLSGRRPGKGEFCVGQHIAWAVLFFKVWNIKGDRRP
jgi:hypothetical protein